MRKFGFGFFVLFYLGGGVKINPYIHTLFCHTIAHGIVAPPSVYLKIKHRIKSYLKQTLMSCTGPGFCTKERESD